MKKLLPALILLALALSLLSGCATNPTDPSAATEQTPAVTLPTETVDASTVFADGDFKDVSGQTPDAEILLSGGEGTISDTTRGSSGSTVTVTSKGIYRITGTSENVTITVNDENESGNVYLLLDNVTMTNDATACIYVAAADKVILQCVGDNSLTCTAASGADGVDGAIYAKDDLTVNGSGSLTVTSRLHGIVCKDDLKLTGAVLTVNAEKIGLQAGDSLRIGGGETSIVSGHDGIQVENSSGDSYFYMESGSLMVAAGYDALDVSGSGGIQLYGGVLDLTAGGGASNSKDSGTSQKGLKTDGTVWVLGAEITLSCADDSVHCDSFSMTSGSLTAASSDDGIHAEDTLSISGGSVSVTKSYEGLEAETVLLSGGEIRVYASDDGINAAGGSDSASAEAGPWAASSGSLTISGGTVYVNADGDGLDSNGSIYVTGGITVVEGPTGDGNGALDKGDGSGCVCSISGGTVLALGSTGMAVNFDSGSQCAALVTLSGSAGDLLTVDDGSGFTFTATKSFACAVYSSPALSQGSTYTLTAGSSSATLDFSSGLYYSTVSGMGGMGGPGGGRP